jgi:hypothetical protein
MPANVTSIGLAGFVGRGKRVLGRLASDRTWRRFYLQRFVRIPAIRKFVSRQIARQLPPPTLTEIGAEAKQHLANLREQGITVFRGASQRDVESLRSYLQRQLCVDPDQPGAGFSWPSGAGRGCVHGYYPIETLLAAPEVLRMANSPRVLQLVENVLGCVPTISEINCWWLRHDFDVETAKIRHDFYVETRKNYHRDIDDWAVLRYFIYLTDVDEYHGPHSYIRGSHNRTLNHRRGVDLDKVYRDLYERRIDVTGPAGTGILMDPFGLHRGMVPSAGDRLILAVSYSLGTINYTAPKAPLVTTDLKVDPFVNRLYVRNTLGLGRT